MQKKIKERPILFSGEMVRAILDGRKTVTRRVVKTQPFERDPWHWQWLKNGKHYQLSEVYTDQQDGSALFPYGPQRLLEQCPYGMPGDRLWVREAWAVQHCFDGIPTRITLEITGVRVERLQDISSRDALSEGITHDTMSDPRVEFQRLWDSIYAERKHGWEANPWVWVVEFMRVTV